MGSCEGSFPPGSPSDPQRWGRVRPHLCYGFTHYPSTAGFQASPWPLCTRLMAEQVGGYDSSSQSLACVCVCVHQVCMFSAHVQCRTPMCPRADLKAASLLDTSGSAGCFLPSVRGPRGHQGPGCAVLKGLRPPASPAALALWPAPSRPRLGPKARPAVSPPSISTAAGGTVVAMGGRGHKAFPFRFPDLNIIPRPQAAWNL